MVRHFGNANDTNLVNGSIEENGCGKFDDINDAALSQLAATGYSHIWLTGVLEQASATSYPHRPADDPAILKGRAGSPYAIRDYFDLCPDYANDPAERFSEFAQLIARIHRHGMKVLIDFVPNHVARSYASDVQPDHSFGVGDQTATFFHRDNHFFYLQPDAAGPPLKLPVDGEVYPPEAEIGKVTGNNAVSWQPSITDWYETVKLNYGHDFTTGRDTSHLPASHAQLDEVPKTWRTMDRILGWWQENGVDGFRCDMAHMVPIEFWAWAIQRARQRVDGCYFAAEAYDGDPAKLTDDNVLEALLTAGFNTIYDGDTYKTVKAIYDGGGWANDIDRHTHNDSSVFQNSLRYAENHDEVRIAADGEWGSAGASVGQPASALLFALSRGPIMIYNGQEVGEAGLQPNGFGGGNQRTSIFDYGSLPELSKWTNQQKYDGGQLQENQLELASWYRQLVLASAHPAFAHGDFYGLNHANLSNPNYARHDGETTSGHWLYSCLRRDPASGKTILVVVHFHPVWPTGEVIIQMPQHALEWIALDRSASWQFTDILDGKKSITTPASQLATKGLNIGPLQACDALYLEITAS
ncbi:alpha-amylase family glycosyl hydrolase [Persicirhabdus sediminis]|nr:alpha-amylase family glycosyl hydrolase [Persicirhabdus sediminis]